MLVKSVADVKRLPIGSRIFLVRSLLGKQAPSARELKRSRSFIAEMERQLAELCASFALNNQPEVTP